MSLKVLSATDGGCVTQHGPGGYGVIMEFYDDAKLLKTVKIIGSFLVTTNNRTELTAAVEVVKRAIAEKVPELEIKVDSQYVREGILKWSKKWIENDWVGSNGQPVKNTDIWIQLINVVTEYRKFGKISWVWVRGHNGDRLNEEADTLATIGNEFAVKGIEEQRSFEELHVEPEDGKDVKPVKSRLPYFMQGKFLYFDGKITDYDKTLVNDEEVYCYYTGSHDGDGNEGKRSHDAIHCVSLLKKPEPVVDELVKMHRNVVAGSLGTIANLRIGRLLTAKRHTEYSNVLTKGETLVNKFLAVPEAQSQLALNGELASSNITPPILAFECMRMLVNLRDVLISHVSGKDVGNTVTELTDFFFDATVVNEGKKNEKTKQKLKAEFSTAAKTATIPIKALGNDINLMVTFGHTIPSRNTFSAAAKQGSKILALTIPEGGGSYRLTIVITNEDGYCIYSASFSCLYFT